MFSSILAHQNILNSAYTRYKDNSLPATQLWIGPEGIGKSLSAKAFAAAVLESSAALRPAEKFVENETHPNLFILRPFPEKKEIAGEQARELLHFMKTTPLYGGEKIVIVDAADQLNRQAANALLKVVEEPPKRTFIIMLAHNLGKILPTIASRAIKIHFNPLAKEAMHHHFPDYDETILTIAEGRPGFAQKLREMDAQALMQGLGKCLFLGCAKNYAILQQTITLWDEKAQKNALDLLPHFLKRLANAPVTATSEGIRKLLEKQPHDRWIEGITAWEAYVHAATQAHIPIKDILYGSVLLLCDPSLAVEVGLQEV